MGIVVRPFTLSMIFFINYYEISERSEPKISKSYTKFYKMIAMQTSKCFHGGPKLNFRQCQRKTEGFTLYFENPRGGPDPRYPPLYPRMTIKRLHYCCRML